jgi:PAS domain S-box-containing protein
MYPHAQSSESAPLMERDLAVDARSELHEQEAKYQSIVRSIDTGFCIIELKFDADGNPLDYCFLEVNPAFERQTGLVDAVGKWMRTLAPEHEQHWFDIYAKVAVSGEPLRFEMPAHALEDRWYDVYAFRIGDAAKRHVGVLFNDITARKRSEAALRRANQVLEQLSGELQRSNEDLSQFARLAGHDLRAPMRNIVQFSQLVLRRSNEALDSESKEYLSFIVEAAKRMSSLLEDVLRYATVAQNAGDFSSPVRAERACSEAVENLRALIEENKADVACSIEHDVTVAVNLGLLTVVFQNLFANAIHYRREGIQPRVRVSAQAEGDCWKFAVQDNGEGIDEHFIERIFEPFARLHGQERPGSGIGLATCKRILQRAQGRIWVESQKSAGSTFYFVLPKFGNA